MNEPHSPPGHKSKGLEWPVVVLFNLDFNRDADLWAPRAGGGGKEGDPLHGRTLRFWPWPFGVNVVPVTKKKRKVTGSELEGDVLLSDEGVAEAVEDTWEAKRLLYVGFTRARDRVILAHRDGKAAWLNLLPNVDQLLDPGLDPGEHPLDGCKTSLFIRHLGPLEAALPEGKPQRETWLSHSKPSSKATKATPRFVSPSSEPAPSENVKITLEDLPGTHPFDVKITDEFYGPVGNAVHSYMGSLPSMTGLSQDTKKAVAQRCLEGFGVAGIMRAQSLVTAGERFEEWVNNRFKDAYWHVETSITSPRGKGGQWNGIIDLVLEAEDRLAIVDHKSSPIPMAICSDKARSFAGQLAGYREAMESQDRPVEEVWIHFPIAGVMARLQVG